MNVRDMTQPETERYMASLMEILKPVIRTGREKRYAVAVVDADGMITYASSMDTSTTSRVFRSLGEEDQYSVKIGDDTVLQQCLDILKVEFMEIPEVLSKIDEIEDNLFSDNS